MPLKELDCSNKIKYEDSEYVIRTDMWLKLNSLWTILKWSISQNPVPYYTYTVEPLISWQSRDSISTVALHWSFGLLDRKEWRDTVEIESRDC